MEKIQISGFPGRVSKLIMGSDYFSPDNYDLVCEMLDAFVEVGGNTIDTACVYGGGNSERAIGMWLRERKLQDDMVILTKGAHHDADGPRVTREAIRQDLEFSLERLGVDSVGLYALHRDNPEIPVGQIVEWLNEHVEDGKFSAFGGSNWTRQRLQEANEYAETHGLRGFSFSSPNLSLAKAQEPYWSGCVSVDHADQQWHEARELPLLSWSSQARGFFTGRFAPENRENKDLVRVFYNDANWERLRRAEQLAKEKNVTAIQIALAYVLNQPFPTAAIVGPHNREEMLSCRAASDLKLTREECEWLDLTAK